MWTTDAYHKHLQTMKQQDTQSWACLCSSRRRTGYGVACEQKKLPFNYCHSERFPSESGRSAHLTAAFVQPTSKGTFYLVNHKEYSWHSSHVSDLTCHIHARSNWTVGLDYICTNMRLTSWKTFLSQWIDEGTEWWRVNFCPSRNLIKSYISWRQLWVTLLNHCAEKFFQSDTILTCICPSPFISQA